MNQSEQDKLIEKALESIHIGYEKLEEIESELENVRNKRSEIMLDNASQGDKA